MPRYEVELKYKIIVDADDIDASYDAAERKLRGMLQGDVVGGGVLLIESGSAALF